jgi:alpha-L-fucosidase
VDARWFDEARFGMFIHWDHASQRGWELSWPMVGGVFSLPRSQQVSPGEYHALAATFDPRAWDPVDLARRAAQAGMRYAVFTTKHHNGFAMWPTALGEHSVQSTPSGRDLVGSYVDAFRAQGLRIGFYFSLSDWHHPDYPAFTDADRPYRLGASPPMPTEDQAERYRAFLRGQLTELLTGYGRIDLLWFDGGWERPSAWFGGAELVAHVRSLQPDIVLNDRLYGFGDVSTPEQFIPATPPAGRWETCLTMNTSWGWNPDDTAYKSRRDIVHALCETVGRGGNLLLNVSPTGDGSLPAEQVERLDELARWMGRHAEAVHGTTAGLAPWQFYGPSTRRSSPSGDRYYLFLLMRPYESVTVRGLPIRRVRAVTLLGDGRSLRFTTRTGILEHFQPDPDGEVVVEVPDDALDATATVLALDVEPAAGS